MTTPWAWFGEERLELRLPRSVAARVALAPEPVGGGEPLALVAAALDAPVGSPPLEERSRGARHVTIFVPDPSRVAAAHVYLLPVVARLARAGLPPRAISVLVARGIHPAASRPEVVRTLGPEVMETLRPVQSAPNAPEFNVSIGVDEELGDVRVHRLAAEADLVVLTGGVVPHHLAGFGGGAKALVPGVAERGTVLAAHRLTMRTVLRPDGSVRSVAGRLEANPFREACLRVARRHGRVFLLSVVLGSDGVIRAAAAGEVGAAHALAAGAWLAGAGGSPEEAAPADLVVVGARAPHDQDLIQAHKALLAAAGAVRPGGPIVWLVRAPAGAGHPDLLPWFEIQGLDRHLAALRQDFHPYGLTAYSLRRLAEEHAVHVVSTLPREVLRPMGFLPFASASAALKHALAHHEVRTATILPG